MIYSCISTKFGQFGTVKLKVKMLYILYRDSLPVFFSYLSQAERSYRNLELKCYIYYTETHFVFFLTPCSSTGVHGAH